MKARILVLALVAISGAVSAQDAFRIPYVGDETQLGGYGVNTGISVSGELGKEREAVEARLGALSQIYLPERQGWTQRASDFYSKQLKELFGDADEYINKKVTATISGAFGSNSNTGISEDEMAEARRIVSQGKSTIIGGGTGASSGSGALFPSDYDSLLNASLRYLRGTKAQFTSLTAEEISKFRTTAPSYEDAVMSTIAYMIKKGDSSLYEMTGGN